MNHIDGFLPGGLVDEQGVVHRQVQLASLRGREELLLSSQQSRDRNAQVTLLLSHCVRQIGSINPISHEVIRNLLVADRQYLLLKLREVSFGDRILATIFCPNPECGKKIDIDFTIADIPIKTLEDKGPLYQMRLSPEFSLVSADEELRAEVVFRLPNGSDQEAIAPLLEEDEEQSAVALLGRCVQRIGSWENPGLSGIAQLSPQAWREIEQQMEQIAPAVELTMAGDCPECRVPFAIPFDLVDYIWSELRISRNQLLREVHYLAFHYHWSEREIMEMPRELRRQYIEILAEEIKRLNGDA